MKKWYAVIGDPISQSMSPWMHENWYKENGIDASFLPIQVKEEKLEEAIASLKLLGCSGWNVTVPHKTAIIPYLDELDPSAKTMNAVNAVEVLEDGRLRGSNTDGHGFVRALEEAFGEACLKKDVLVIGAGGAARGIAFALHEAGYGPITFTNRTIQKAEQLAAEIPTSSAIPLDQAEEGLSSYGLVVQTTSVGMNFAQEGMPLNPKNIEAGTVVADIIYNPLETAFLKSAREQGAFTMNGTGMFIHQGALAFEKWTTVRPDTAKMIKKLTETLGGSTC